METRGCIVVVRVLPAAVVPATDCSSVDLRNDMPLSDSMSVLRRFLRCNGSSVVETPSEPSWSIFVLDGWLIGFERV